MRCGKGLIGVGSILLFAIPASELSAQVTGQQALDALAAAATEMKGATDERKAATSSFGVTSGNGLTQIGRAVFNLGQMTAQEKSACAREIDRMFWNGVGAHIHNKEGNEKMQAARTKVGLGFWFLLNNNPAAAKTAFDDAKSDAGVAKSKWFDGMGLDTFTMQGHIDMLKATIDEAIQ